MKVSVNWIRHINEAYGCSADPMPKGIDELVEKIGAQLGAVEEVVDLGKKYKGIVVVKVIKCQKHPNADKLTVCLVDDGSAIKKVRRDKNGLVEIVCGATNVKEGMLAAWIPPGTTVPATVDKEPFVIEAREIRGIVSNGMIASQKELDLGDNHEGILVLAEHKENGEWRMENGESKPIPNSQFSIPNPGDSFAKALALDDYIIDIENKMFTHRPDLFGMLGVARELAGIQQHMFKSPDWYRPDAKIPKSNARDDHKLAIKNELPKLVPRFCAVVMKDIKVEPSPIWLQSYLARVGVKAINNIVDLTNYYMLLTSQPLHAYDYDKVLALQKDQNNGVKMSVRLSKKGEQLRLLGGKLLKLDEAAILITAGDKPIGLGGVMGGADTEVDETTKNIVIECANFDMYQIRKTTMHYGLFTDAATRFTKGQSPRQNPAALAKIVEDVKHIAGGRVSGGLIDSRHFKEQDVKVSTTTDFINERLGLGLNPAMIKKLLENVEFRASVSGKNLEITAPFWRMDIEIAEDIVEEVGRLYGYDHLPLILPAKNLSPAKINEMMAFKQRLRNILTLAGGNEVLTYSFVQGSLLASAHQDPKDAFHIKNALSPDLQYYRLCLSPSLLEKVHPNVKNGYESFCLFEIGSSHVRGVNDREKLPTELQRVSFVAASNEAAKNRGAPYYWAKEIADFMAVRLGIDGLVYDVLNDAKNLPKEWAIAAAAFEPRRSCIYRSKNTVLGIIGEPNQDLARLLKLPTYSAMAELDLLALEATAQPTRYQPLNRFPKISQDLCLRVDSSVTFSELGGLVEIALNKACEQEGYRSEMNALDIFQRPSDKKHWQTTFRITLWHPGRTLTSEGVNKLLDKIASEAKKKLNAERI